VSAWAIVLVCLGAAPRWPAPSGWGGVGRRVARRRLYPKPKHARRIFAKALILLLPTGCLTAAGSVVRAGASSIGAYWDWKGAKKGKPVIVTPPIETYSKEVQAGAAVGSVIGLGAGAYNSLDKGDEEFRYFMMDKGYIVF